MSTTSRPFWALIELMGQQRAIGLCSWKDGGKLHVDLLGADGKVKTPPSTFGPCALYRVVEVTEEVAVATAAKINAVGHLPYWAETPKPPASPMPGLRVGMHVVWDLRYGRVLHASRPLVVLEQVVEGRIVQGVEPVRRFTDDWLTDARGGFDQIRDENHKILWTRPGCTTIYDDSCPPIPF